MRRSPSRPMPPESILHPTEAECYHTRGLLTAGKPVVALCPRKVRPPAAATNEASPTDLDTRRNGRSES